MSLQERQFLVWERVGSGLYSRDRRAALVEFQQVDCAVLERRVFGGACPSCRGAAIPLHQAWPPLIRAEVFRRCGGRARSARAAITAWGANHYLAPVSARRKPAVENCVG